jgi:hypothetical protein
MNWFKKHLNWTAVIILFASTALIFLLGLISLGFYAYPHSVELHDPLVNNVLIISFSCCLLAIIGFGWILRQKNRSLLFLLFFVPLISPLVITFQSESVFHILGLPWSLLPLVPTDFSEQVVVAGMLLPIFLSIIGFALLLRLRNLSAKKRLPVILKLLLSFYTKGGQKAQSYVR